MLSCSVYNHDKLVEFLFDHFKVCYESLAVKFGILSKYLFTI